MDRRTFLRMAGLSAAGLTYLPGKAFTFDFSNTGKAPFVRTHTKISLNADGSFNIAAGKQLITNCYPSFDMQQIKPVRIQLSDSPARIAYYLPENRQLILDFKEDEQGLIISTRLEGFRQLPRFVFPLAEGSISGAERFFKQGMGFAGPSGIFRFPPARAKLEMAVLKEQVWSYDSYMVTGLFDDETAMTISVQDHSRFLFRSTLYNKHYRFGLIDRHLNTEDVFLKSGFQTEGIFTDKGTVKLPDITISSSANAFDLFRELAEETASFNRVSLPHSPRYYYCSWYDMEYRFTEKDLSEKLSGLAAIEPPVPIQAIQIDDGYCFLGDWLNSNHRFPGGMKRAFGEIKKAGYGAGIWIAPFMVSSDTFIFKNHKDWLLKDKSGEIITEWETYHSGGSVHVLDSSHPEAFEYLRRVFATMKEWGATTFKTDFLDWGLRDSSLVTRYTPGKTSVEYFRDVALMIRETIGPDSYWMSCIAPFAPLIGLVDGMRLSNDVSPAWSKESTVNMFREMFYGQYFNHVYWQNDPDVCYMREYNSTLTENEKVAIACYNGIMGGVVNTSDDFGQLDKEQIQLFRFLEPGPEKGFARLPFWGKDDSLITAVRHFGEPESEVGPLGLLFVNTSEEPVNLDVELSALDITPGVYVFAWSHLGANKIGRLNRITHTIPARSCKLFYLNPVDEPPAPHLRISGYRI